MSWLCVTADVASGHGLRVPETNRGVCLIRSRGHVVYRGNGTTRPRDPVPMRVSRCRPQMSRAHPTASATDPAGPLGGAAASMASGDRLGGGWDHQDVQRVPRPASKVTRRWRLTISCSRARRRALSPCASIRTGHSRLKCNPESRMSASSLPPFVRIGADVCLHISLGDENN